MRALENWRWGSDEYIATQAKERERFIHSRETDVSCEGK